MIGPGVGTGSSRNPDVASAYPRRDDQEVVARLPDHTARADHLMCDPLQCSQRVVVKIRVAHYNARSFTEFIDKGRHRLWKALKNASIKTQFFDK